MTSILLVEDNDMNRDMLSRRLERKGFTVHIAIDGADGCDKAASISPDLVLMDMSLPVMNGWQAVSHLKADSCTSAIPIIGLSAHAMSGDRQRALEVGCDDYDTKPVDFNRLLGKIQNQLD
jgi:CheY-like chemotaxis protein